MKKYAIKVQTTLHEKPQDYVLDIKKTSYGMLLISYDNDVNKAKLYDTKEQAQQDIQRLQDDGWTNEFKIEEITLTWKHNSGDNEETYDWYLWINKKPTNNLISGYAELYYYYINGKQRGMADTLKEAKETILEELGY